MSYRLPEHALSERFLSGSGPGGQHANNAATAVQLRIDIAALDLPPFARSKLSKIAARWISAEGELVITARDHRSQDANRAAARERAEAVIGRALHRERRRKPTRPSLSARNKRTDRKTRRGATKRLRGKPRID